MTATTQGTGGIKIVIIIICKSVTEKGELETYIC